MHICGTRYCVRFHGCRHVWQQAGKICAPTHMQQRCCHKAHVIFCSLHTVYDVYSDPLVAVVLSQTVHVHDGYQCLIGPILVNFCFMTKTGCAIMPKNKKTKSLGVPNVGYSRIHDTQFRICVNDYVQVPVWTSSERFMDLGHQGRQLGPLYLVLKPYSEALEWLHLPKPLEDICGHILKPKVLQRILSFL